MVIGVCDDNNVMLKHMVSICETVAETLEEDVSIVTFYDGRAVLDEDLDILILDIEMEDVDGITVKDIFQPLIQKNYSVVKH